jgi:hypothetical protein
MDTAFVLSKAGKHSGAGGWPLFTSTLHVASQVKCLPWSHALGVIHTTTVLEPGTEVVKKVFLTAGQMADWAGV